MAILDMLARETVQIATVILITIVIHYFFIKKRLDDYNEELLNDMRSSMPSTKSPNDFDDQMT